MLLAQESTEWRAASDRGVHVRFVDPGEEPSWNETLGRLDGATFFHTASWCRVLKDAYGFRPAYAVAEGETGVRGVLPLMEVENWPRGRRGIALPFSDECDALTVEDSARELLGEAAVARGRAGNWKYLECRGASIFPRALPSLSYYRHRLLLETDEDSMFGRFEPSVQRAIRRAEKAGLKVEVETSLESLRTFYALHCRTRQRHGVPPQPFRFFEALHRHVVRRDEGFVVTARIGSKAVASAMIGCSRSKAVYKFGASDDRLQNLRGNNLVLWAGIQHLIRHGFTELHLGRTSLDNEGLRRFKLGWGASESRIEYRKLCMIAQRFVQDVDRASGWQNRVFRFIPKPVARCVGRLLYARLA